LNATHPVIQIQLRPETTEEQYWVVAWAITVVNAFNRRGVTTASPCPPGTDLDEAQRVANPLEVDISTGGLTWP
jgi:hypothetical protein